MFFKRAFFNYFAYSQSFIYRKTDHLYTLKEISRIVSCASQSKRSVGRVEFSILPTFKNSRNADAAENAEKTQAIDRSMQIVITLQDPFINKRKNVLFVQPQPLCIAIRGEIRRLLQIVRDVISPATSYWTKRVARL